jgi:hypothetical protein
MALILIATAIVVVIALPWIVGSLFWFGEHRH